MPEALPSRQPSLREIIGASSMSSSQYPPPPSSDDPHYTPIYPAPSNPQLLDGQQPQPPQRLAYGQDIYPKIENLSDVLQQQAQHASHALSDQRSRAPGHPAAEQQAVKPNRLRKACDSCSIRKVKCDESGPPCRACAALEIPCTFDRPSRRRGPPNRHAEAIKKRRLEGVDTGSGTSSPASPTHAAHALAQLHTSHPPSLSAEAICPLQTMNALIDDFFTYIHPLCPFPHEPLFRQAWEQRNDLTDPSFLALLASMVACLVASFPRKPRLHLKNQTRNEYPSHLSLVEKCRDVCFQARGPRYLDRPGLNVYDACTSYFLGLTGAYTFQWRQLRLYFGECLTILRSLGLHKAQDPGYTRLGGLPTSVGSNGPNFDGSRDLKVDHITEQIGRRVFWTLFVGVRTMQQIGASFGELTILPATPTEPLPPLPVEVDDAFIYPQEIMPQPTGVVPTVAGFNINVRIYTSYSTLSTSEMAFGIDELYDWDQQQRILEQCLQRCRQVLDNIPEVLQVHPKDSQNGRFAQRRPYYPPMPEFVNMRDPALNAYNGAESQDVRRSSQYEIQKANIYASHLSIRSYIVEKYFVLLDKSNNAKTQQALQSSPNALATGLDRLVSSSASDAEALEKRMSEEREQVVKDLLVVLGSIDMVNMEPNGDSFVSLLACLEDFDFLYEVSLEEVGEAKSALRLSCPTSFILQKSFLSPIAGLRLFSSFQTQKIRSIASTLLEVPRERKGSVALQHQDYLYKFLDVLSKLERVSPEGSDPNGGPVDEEAELRHWADLRDYQLKFQEQGGVYGYS